jgi:1,4-dihydroxy-2-naphthoate octaprenyltransferase
MKLGDLLMGILFGILLIIMGLFLLTHDTTYRGYPLPRMGGLVVTVWGMLWLFSVLKRK